MEEYHERLKTCYEISASDGIAFPYKTKLDKLNAFLDAENKEDFLDARFINTYAAAKYIHHRYKNKIDYAIFDEVHQLMGKDSMQSKAFSLISSSAKKKHYSHRHIDKRICLWIVLCIVSLFQF